jgi:hypothetical protein
MSNTRKPVKWKQKALHEIIQYWVTFLYLAVFFGAFITYRRLVLAQYDISYLHYGVSLLEALILAKVILIGDALHFGQKIEPMPLIYPTIYKAAIFTLWVGLFKLAEHTISGLFQGKGLAGGFDELEHEGMYAFLAKCVIIFSAFIPFFAFKELGRVMGEGRISQLFFRGGIVAGSGPSNGSHPGHAT